MSAKARGALTLGLGQTKDHTVQAAMRLRQLGTTQAIVFVAPPEVHQSILDLRRMPENGIVNSYDVICWLLEQTCNGIEQMQPLYYAQGADYCHRIQAALNNSHFFERSRSTGALPRVTAYDGATHTTTTVRLEIKNQVEGSNRLQISRIDGFHG